MTVIKKTIKTVLPNKIIDMASAYYFDIKDNDWAKTRWFFSLKRFVSHVRLRQFKDIHAGKKCFIIGNGPSLNKMDLRPLRNEVTFGLNRIYLLFPKIGFHTNYLLTVNKLVIEQSAHEIADLPMPIFLSSSARHVMPFTHNVIFLKTIAGEHRFSLDPGKILWESGTVTYVALQLAYYMGFQKVILIGVDHNFVTKGPANSTVVSGGDDPNHFDPNYFGKGFKWQLPDLASSELGYHLAKRVYQEDGRQILDATVGGKLTIFPKISYAEALSIPQ